MCYCQLRWGLHNLGPGGSQNSPTQPLLFLFCWNSSTSQERLNQTDEDDRLVERFCRTSHLVCAVQKYMKQCGFPPGTCCLWGVRWSWMTLISTDRCTLLIQSRTFLSWMDDRAREVKHWTTEVKWKDTNCIKTKEVTEIKETLKD